MLRIWKEGGGCGPLPIEVERWEGVVREHAGEPVGMKEMSEVEKKVSVIFATTIVTVAHFRFLALCGLT